MLPRRPAVRRSAGLRSPEGVIPEGVLERELVEPPSRGLAQAGRWRRALERGRAADGARLRIAISGPERVLVALSTDVAPLRLGDLGCRARRAGDRSRCPPRHAVRPAGRHVRLGADRRYTGPDCPEDMLEVGGIPQGDYVPGPWLVSSAG